MMDRKVYYPHMPSIIGKKRGNQTYYYLVESARVDGKPRIVDQQYLGSTAEVMARLTGAPAGSPERTQHKQFGDLAGVWGILERLKVAEAIDEACGPGDRMRPRRSGPTWRWPPPTGSSRHARSWPLRIGGPPPPGRGSPNCPSPRPTTAGSGTPWTPLM